MGSPRFLKPSGNQAPTLDIWTFGTQILERTGRKVLHCLFSLQCDLFTPICSVRKCLKASKASRALHTATGDVVIETFEPEGHGIWRERERALHLHLHGPEKPLNTKQYKNTTNNSKAPQASHPSSSCRQPCLNVHLAGSHSHVIRELDFENFGALAILWPFGFFWTPQCHRQPAAPLKGTSANPIS